MHNKLLKLFERATRWIALAGAAVALAACGGLDETAMVATPSAQTPPTIASLTATPAALPAGGGPVVLAWASSDAATLTIDNGVGDVSGSTSKTVAVSASTTFTLTATNAAGTVTRSTAVAVAALPAPTITSFSATPASLPTGGGSVTLSWVTTDAANLSIDNGVGVVTGTSAVVNVTANTTFTLTATNATGMVTQTTGVSVAVASSGTLYVDAATGADTNPCTQAAPCKSLTKAMAGSPAGATFLLADGLYTPDTEGGGGINIPDGATLQAIHPGAATLATLATNVIGSATLNGIVIDRKGTGFGCGGINAGSSTGAPTLTLIGVFSNCTNWLSLTGKVKATMTPGALPGGAYTTGLPAGATQWARTNGASELLIQGGMLDGHGSGNAYPQAALLGAGGTSTLTLDAVTVRNWPQAALSAEGGNIVLRNGTQVDTVGKAGVACNTGSAMLVGGQSGRLTMDHATLSNAAGAGVCVLNNFSTSLNNSLQLTQSTITQSGGAAIQNESTQGVGAVITADGANLTNNAYGIFWTGRTGTSFDLRNSTVSGSTVAGGIGIYIYFAESSSLKLRGSTVSGNAQYGVEIDGNLAADLGSQIDPGNNTFTGNALAGLRSMAATGQFVDAVGNTWLANQQGADANGHYSIAPLYAPVPKVGPASGLNFKIDNATAVNL
jgi:hypothetical protein